MEVVFCANDHLMLNAPCCPECGWQPPKPVLSGEIAWGPSETKTILGGGGRKREMCLAVLDQTIALAAETSVSALRKTDGKLLWSRDFGRGRMVRRLIPFRNSFLAAICDERSIMDTPQFGGLYLVDIKDGSSNRFWESESQSVSQPVLAQNGKILLRTGDGELMIMTTQPDIRVEKRVRLASWWPAADLVLTGNQVVVVEGWASQNKGEIALFEVDSGRQIWRQPTNGLVASTPLVYSGWVIYQEGEQSNQNVVARRINDGSLAWSSSFSKIYTPLLLVGDRVYGVFRGSHQPLAADHYQLWVIDVVSGAVLTRKNLGERVSNLGYFPRDILLLAYDSGKLAAVDLAAGGELWTRKLTTPDDPLCTPLIVAGDVVVAGLASGKIISFQMKVLEETSSPPHVYLEAGQYKKAADAYALGGDVLAAAKIYDEKLHDPQKAWQLYQKAGDFEHAANVASKAGLFQPALKCYQDAGNVKGQAEILYKMGDLLGAGALMEQVGALKTAALWFEQGRDLSRAYEIYIHIGNQGEADRLLNLMPVDAQHIDLLQKLGKFEEAAQLSVQKGYLEKAVELFHQAQNQVGEMRVLSQLVKQKPDTWSLNRLAELAESQKDYESAAEARFQLKEFQKAAVFFEKAGDLIELEDSVRAARLLEQAADCYREINDEEEGQRCLKRILFILKLPNIVAVTRIEKVFRAKKVSRLELGVINQGFGPARDLCVMPLPPMEQFFEMVKETSDLRINNIPPDHEHPVFMSLYIRPREDGELPLKLQLTWKNVSGNRSGSMTITLTLNVKTEGEHSSSGNQPVNNYYYGSVISQQDGSRIEIASGDLIKGDKFDGDKVESGGQKGDRVEVIHGVPPLRGAACVKCGRLMEPDQAYCPNCGHKPGGNNASIQVSC